MKPIVYLERNVTQTKNEFFVIKDIENATSVVINKIINLKQGEGPQIEMCIGDTITPEQSKLLGKKSKLKITDYVSPFLGKWNASNEK